MEKGGGVMGERRRKGKREKGEIISCRSRG